MGEVLETLNDLIAYFQQPDSELEHEEKQRQLRSLIKRQDLFKEEVRSIYNCSRAQERKKKDVNAFIPLLTAALPRSGESLVTVESSVLKCT